MMISCRLVHANVALCTDARTCKFERAFGKKKNGVVLHLDWLAACLINVCCEELKIIVFYGYFYKLFIKTCF